MLLSLLFLVAFTVQLIFYWVVLSAAFRPDPAELATPIQSAGKPVSVIVCFKNEEATLARLIELILGQDYPGEFELVLVDDHSTDNSASVVHPFAIQRDKVHLVTPGPTRPGKKDALSFGIQAARYDLLLLTDADCLPASNQWLRLMVSPLHRGKQLVLGASPYLIESGAHLLTAWQRFESVYVSLKYLGFARRKHPYMGVGRNLAYTKSFFQSAGGFAAHAHVASGDDDLLVGAAAVPDTAATVTHPGAWVYSHPEITWRNYFRQRARHQSTGSFYAKFIASNLTLLAASHGFFYLLGFALLFTPYAYVAIVAYLLRLLILLKVYRRPLLDTDPTRYAGAIAGARLGITNGAKLLANVAFFDCWIGPMYLYLALAGLVGRKGW